MLQARQLEAPFAIFQTCKLMKEDSEGYRALMDMERFIQNPPKSEDGEESEYTRMMGKVKTYDSLTQITSLRVILGTALQSSLDEGS